MGKACAMAASQAVSQCGSHWLPGPASTFRSRPAVSRPPGTPVPCVALLFLLTGAQNLLPLSHRPTTLLLPNSAHQAPCRSPAGEASLPPCPAGVTAPGVGTKTGHRVALASCLLASSSWRTEPSLAEPGATTSPPWVSSPGNHGLSLCPQGPAPYTMASRNAHLGRLLRLPSWTPGSRENSLWHWGRALVTISGHVPTKQACGCLVQALQWAATPCLPGPNTLFTRRFPEGLAKWPGGAARVGWAGGRAPGCLADRNLQDRAVRRGLGAAEQGLGLAGGAEAAPSGGRCQAFASSHPGVCLPFPGPSCLVGLQKAEGYLGQGVPQRLKHTGRCSPGQVAPSSPPGHPGGSVRRGPGWGLSLQRKAI